MTENSKLRFTPSYNKIVVKLKSVEPASKVKIYAPDGSENNHPIESYSSHPKQAQILSVGPLSDQYEGTVNAGDHVLLRMGTMIEPVIIQGKVYALITPTDILGVTTYHGDIKLEEDTEFYKKTRQK